jgi:uncharacterized protein YjbI with pentapeptide repeats
MQFVLSLMLAASLTFTTPTLPAQAVSGGGKDFSGATIEARDFSGQKLDGKEFRGAFGTRANFKGASLQSASFFKADLNDAIFDGADLTGASLENAGLEGASFDNAVLTTSYLTDTIKDAKSIAGADFSDAVIPSPTQKQLCKRADAKGVNPTTQVDTRESLMCPE